MTSGSGAQDAPAERAPPRVFLSLGSNVGDRELNLRQAVARLAVFLEHLRVSSLYETDPLYVTNQPRFLNIVAAGPCRLSPHALLERIHEVERELGRERTRELPKGPRTIDIDILLYGQSIVDTAALQIPHPGLSQRLFALLPLLEIDPRAREPGSGRRYAAISQALRAAAAEGGGKPQGVYIFAPW